MSYLSMLHESFRVLLNVFWQDVICDKLWPAFYRVVQSISELLAATLLTLVITVLSIFMILFMPLTTLYSYSKERSRC